MKGEKGLLIFPTRYINILFRQRFCFYSFMFDVKFFICFVSSTRLSFLRVGCIISPFINFSRGETAIHHKDNILRFKHTLLLDECLLLSKMSGARTNKIKIKIKICSSLSCLDVSLFLSCVWGFPEFQKDSPFTNTAEKDSFGIRNHRNVSQEVLLLQEFPRKYLQHFAPAQTSSSGIRILGVYLCSSISLLYRCLNFLEAWISSEDYVLFCLYVS